MRAAAIQLVVVFAAALETTAASTACAEPVETFADVCIATDGDPSLATAAALKAGWSIASAEVRANFAGGPIEQMDVYSSDIPNEYLMIGTAVERVDLRVAAPLRAGFCSVSGVVNQSVVFERLEAAMGIAPVETRGETVFLYSRAESGIVSESGVANLPAAEFITAARQRSIHLVQVQAGEHVTVLGLIPIRP